MRSTNKVTGISVGLVLALCLTSMAWAAEPAPDTLRLYVLDCGTIDAMDDITYMAMSHYHGDHTANANAFANTATWIVQQPEYDVMFAGDDVGVLTPDTYKDLEFARRLMLPSTDHDVFGDGTVVIKFAPGHTLGHQMLFLDLSNTGPLLLSGDLWHLPEERSLDRVPTFDADGAMTRRSRVLIEQFIEDSGAQMWIQHDPPTYAGLKKAPAFYD